MNNFFIIGGDKRNLFLCDLLKKDGYNVDTYFLGDNDKNKNLYDLVKKNKYIILPIPFSVNQSEIYCPFSDKKLKICELIEIIEKINYEGNKKDEKNKSNLDNKKIIFGGNIDKKYFDILEKNYKIFDYMKNPEIVKKNVIPTTEGIIKIIIENTDITIYGANICILGFGKIGKYTAKILNNLGANIWCYDNKEEEIENIKLNSYNSMNDCVSCLDTYKSLYEFSIKKDLKFDIFDVIINTIPQLILDSNVLNKINKDETFIIDIASGNGGIDYKYAEKNNYKYIHARGLPGKIAPKSCSKNILEFIYKNCEINSKIK